MEEGRRSALRAGGLVLIGAVVGSLLGPPIASAVGSLVTIQGGSSSSQAKVSSGRLQVDTGGVSTQTFRCGPGNKKCTSLIVSPFGSVGVTGSGASVIASGTASGTASCSGSAQAVSIDNGTAQPVTVAITAKTFNGKPLDVWQGTAPGNGHLNDTFGTGGVGYNQPLTVTESGGAAKWFVYGDCFGPPPASHRRTSSP